VRTQRRSKLRQLHRHRDRRHIKPDDVDSKLRFGVAIAPLEVGNKLMVGIVPAGSVEIALVVHLGGQSRPVRRPCALAHEKRVLHSSYCDSGRLPRARGVV
jgi:hypothetical protein